MQCKSGLLLAGESNYGRHVQLITEHRGSDSQTQSSTECSIQYTTHAASDPQVDPAVPKSRLKTKP